MSPIASSSSKRQNAEGSIGLTKLSVPLQCLFWDVVTSWFKSECHVLRRKSFKPRESKRVKKQLKKSNPFEGVQKSLVLSELLKLDVGLLIV